MSHLQRLKTVLIKVLLALAAIIGAGLLYRWLLFPALMWAFAPGDAVALELRRFGILLFALLGYCAYVRVVEKRAPRELLPAPLASGLGLLSGSALMLLAIVPLFALGAYEVTAQPGLRDGVFAVAGFILIAAMLEEVLYRGVLFQALEQQWGTLPAMWLQALIFGLAHVRNVVMIDGGVWDVVATVVSVTLLGVLWSLLFAYTRNLWVSGLHHTAWNLTILLSGVPLSGNDDWRSVAPLLTEYRAPDWLTGGLFGPENAILTLLLVSVAVAVMTRRMQQRGRLLRGDHAQLAPAR